MADLINFTLEIDKVPEDTFNVISFNLRESISHPFELEIEILSRNEHLDENDTIDQEAIFTLWRNGCVERYVHGIVYSFSRSDCGFSHRRYKIVMVPELFRLNLRENCRIFQDIDTEKIITTLLREMGIHNYSFSLIKKLKKREYCVQYRESDLDFITRLASEEGIGYIFEHKKKKHTVIFFDNLQALKSHAGSLKYNALSGGASPQPFVHSFSNTCQLAATSVSLKDYSFKRPAQRLLHQTYISGTLPHSKKYEHFDYPGRFQHDDDGKTLSRYRLEHIRSKALLGVGKSNILSLTMGEKFELIDHPDSTLNCSWLATKITHVGEQPQAAEEYAGDGSTKYLNRFDVMP